MPAPTKPGVTLTIGEVAWLVLSVAGTGTLDGGNRPAPTMETDSARLDRLARAVAVVMAESGGNTAAYRPASRNPGGGEDRGLWQINSRYHPDVTDDEAYQAGWSTRWAFRKSAGFTDFGLWAADDGIGAGQLSRARTALAAPVDPTARLAAAGQLSIAGPPVQSDADRLVDTIGGALGAAVEWPVLLADLLRRLLDAALWRRVLIGAAGVAVIVAAIVLAARNSILPKGLTS